jgi:hypothetical protein
MSRTAARAFLLAISASVTLTPTHNSHPRQFTLLIVTISSVLDVQDKGRAEVWPQPGQCVRKLE